MSKVLVDALNERQLAYREALDRLRDAAPDDANLGEVTWLLRESIELAGCLRRLLAGRTVAEIHRAFGAPGDFGYGTPIGDALATIYRASCEPKEPR
jgi:hypothetical protein